MSPTIRWRNEKFPDDPKNIVFRNNIIVDDVEKYSNERGIVTVGTYMSDEVYDITAGRLKFENNCYFNPRTAVQFSMGAGFNYKDGYRKGDTYSLQQWQTKYGYDAGSIEKDPLFVDADKGDFQLRADSPCGNLGRYGMPDGVPLSAGP